MISCTTLPVCFPELSVTVAGHDEIGEDAECRKSIAIPVESILLTELTETVGNSLSLHLKKPFSAYS